MACGIYMIRNKINNKVYIGSSYNTNKRFKDHINFLNKNIEGKCNRYLQNEWNKYGQCNFEFCIIEECNKDSIIDRENFWIDHYNSLDRDFGYNRQRAGTYPTIDDSYREKVRKGRLGKRWSAEMRKLLSDVHKKGKIKIVDEANGMFGKNHSTETKELIRQAQLKHIKIKESDAIDIINKLVNGCAIKQLSKEYGVSDNTIIRIRDGHTWKHLRRP